MKFNKLPKEKRIHLVLVLVGTVAVLSALGLLLIQHQFENIRQIHLKRQAKEAQLKQMEDAITQKDKIDVERRVAVQRLAVKENQMASGDLYSWMINDIRRLKLSHPKVDIPQIGQTAEKPELRLLPNFPYKQTTSTLGGLAYYQDLGKFLADVENEFPYLRIVNLDLGPASSSGPGEEEKLAFKLDVVALVKPDHN